MFGGKLKELRNRRNLSLSDLAKNLGTTAMSISRYENNQRQPDYETLKKFADFFEVSVDYLLDRTNIPDYKPMNTSTITIPVFSKFNTFESGVPISTFEIASNHYDYVLAPEKLIAFRILDDAYVPYFLGGDLLIIELTENVYNWSQYYLTTTGEDNKILELIEYKDKYIFIRPSMEGPKIFTENPKILGRVLTLHREL